MCSSKKKSGSISISEIKGETESTHACWACFKNKNKKGYEYIVSV